MKTLLNNPKMVLVTTYPPRECGIAIFSQDLTNAINTLFGHTLLIEICALENDAYSGRKYGKQVTYILNTRDLAV